MRICNDVTVLPSHADQQARLFDRAPYCVIGYILGA